MDENRGNTMTALELFEQLNALDEHERVEAKRASEVGKSLLETVCAFANEPGLDGGWILLGVVREEMALFPAYEVEGVANPDKVSADLASQCRSTFNTPVNVDITTEHLQGKAVVVVRVPEAPAQNKPIFFQSRGLPKGALRRVGSTDQHCTDDDLSLFYQGRQTDTFDNCPVEGTTLDDISPDAVADYRQARFDIAPDAEELRWTDEELLQSLNCIKRLNGSWRLTLAGLLLFGKPQALRRCMPMTRVDYIRVPGRDWIPDPETRFETVELRDSLFRLIRRAQAAVMDDLPKGFGLAEGDLQRQDKPAIPQRVIREAIVNAVMHRSYRSHSPVQIIRYANRLEIRNPGFSLKSPEHLGEPGSQPRNPSIAAVLHETRFAETKGSGIRVMRETMRQAGLTPPLFESDRGHDQFVARYLFHHFLGPEDIAWLAQFRRLQLADDDAKALVFVKEAGVIDNATYRELSGVDTLTASGALRRLRDAGLLIQQGRGSATHYVLAAGLLPVDITTPFLSSNPPSLSSNPRLLSSNASMPTGGRSLPNNKRGADAGRRNDLLNRVKGNLAARIGSLGQRNAPEEVREIVIELCSNQEWSAEDLAILLQRNTEYVRHNYLRPLLKNKRLEMTNPEDINDPKQAYRTSLVQPPVI
jgi:ATP-dependent DNA helicase RecG